ncbi:unnamed protein product [Lactuca saligna]|uniref:Uncharacterized protein n=1 Tax=Lactuca saligna TaxID=75948 RepID=A0AA36DZZ6_LACSI|nr:unnamed protein product [Lactuca saligna]
MSTSLTPKSTICNKIASFDKYNFAAWKSKVMEALEFLDFDMLDVINKGSIATMHKSSYDGAFSSKLKGKSVPGYNKEEEKMLNLNIIITLSSAFEKENSSDDEGKCLVAQIVESHADTAHDSIGNLDVGPSHADKDFKLEWDNTQHIR